MTYMVHIVTISRLFWKLYVNLETEPYDINRQNIIIFNHRRYFVDAV